MEELLHLLMFLMHQEVNRVYKKAWDDEKIFNLFKEERAKHFDPKLVDIFFEHLDEFLKIRETFRDEL